MKANPSMTAKSRSSTAIGCRECSSTSWTSHEAAAPMAVKMTMCARLK